MFASRQAENLAREFAGQLGLSVESFLAWARDLGIEPGGVRGGWRARDVRAAKAAIEAAPENHISTYQCECGETVPEDMRLQHEAVCPGPKVDPALAASQKTADAALGEFEAPQPVLICEECGSDLAVGPHADDCPVLAEELEEAGGQPGLWTRFTGWAGSRRQQAEAAAARAGERAAAWQPPTIQRPSWLRMPEVRRPSFQRPQVRVPDGARNTWSRFDRWLTAEGDSRQQAVRLGGTLAVVLLILAVVGAAGLLVALRGISVAVAPVPSPMQTQMAAVVSTTTPVPRSTVRVRVIGTPPPPGEMEDPFALARRIEELEAENETLRQQAADLESNLEPTAKMVDELSSEMLTLRDKNTALQVRLAASTARVVELEAQLAEAAEQPSPPAPPTVGDHTVTVTGHIENGAGMEVVLFAGSVIVASTTDASGNYTFTNVTEGEYAVAVGEATTTVAVSAGAESVTVAGFHKVVKEDNLWNMYGPHTWQDFTEFADAHGLKHFVDGQGRLIVTIQPGQIFNLAEMPAAG